MEGAWHGEDLLADEVEWARIEHLMPRGRRGARRVDDRRMMSGIVHMLRSGARWRDCPAACGPYTTVYNRFNRRSRQGLWLRIFEAPTGKSPIHGMAVWSSSTTVHRLISSSHRAAAACRVWPSPLLALRARSHRPSSSAPHRENDLSTTNSLRILIRVRISALPKHLITPAWLKP